MRRLHDQELFCFARNRPQAEGKKALERLVTPGALARGGANLLGKRRAIGTDENQMGDSGYGNICHDRYRKSCGVPVGLAAYHERGRWLLAQNGEGQQ